MKPATNFERERGGNVVTTKGFQPYIEHKGSFASSLSSHDGSGIGFVYATLIMAVFFLVLGVSLGHAEEPKRVKFFYYHAYGKNGVNIPQTRDIMKALRDLYLRDHNIRVVDALLHGRDPCGRVDISYAARHWCLGKVGEQFRRLAKKNRFIRPVINDKKTIKMAVLGPLWYLNEDYQGGFASSIGAYNRRFGYGYFNARMKNIAGEDRFLHSIIAGYHETSHLLGAEHDNADYGWPWCSYMHEAALQCVPFAIATEFNKTQIAWRVR